MVRGGGAIPFVNNVYIEGAETGPEAVKAAGNSEPQSIVIV